MSFPVEFCEWNEDAGNSDLIRKEKRIAKKSSKLQKYKEKIESDAKIKEEKRQAEVEVQLKKKEMRIIQCAKQIAIGRSPCYSDVCWELYLDDARCVIEEYNDSVYVLFSKITD